MKDRFKFRVWHKPLKQMHYNDFIVTATGYMAKIYQQDDYMMKFNQEDLEFDKQCILMQCTGLKDKNGKLIYEGDIVKHSKSNQQYKVQWNDKGFWQLDDNAMARSAKFLEENYEVIGNIYENPELLED